MEMSNIAPAGCSPSFLPNDHATDKQGISEINAVVAQVATSELNNLEVSVLERSIAPGAIEEGTQQKVTLLQPDNTSDEVMDVTGAIVSIALAGGLGVEKLGVGAKILQHSIGLASYSNLTSNLGYLGTCRPVQYVVGNMASKAGLQAINYSVCGITAGTVCSVGFAVLTAVSVAQVGVSIHNHCFAKAEEDKISINPFKMAKKAFAMCSGWGATAAAA